MGHLHAERADHREMVRRLTREATAMDVELSALQRHVPVDAIQLEQREPRRVRAAHAAHRRRELATQTARDRAEVPLVEVAHQDARPRKLMRDRDEAAEEIELAPALAGVQAEVTDEDVQRRAADLDVDAKAA